MDSDRNRRDSQTTGSSRERLVAAAVRPRRRRYALYYLHQQSGPVSVEEVARQVAAWERSTTTDEVAPERAATVAASLRRRHVPALVEHDLAAYNHQRDRVVGSVNDPTVELLLANDPRTRVAWYKVYLAVTAISSAFLALVRYEVPPLDRVEPVAAAALVVALFAAVSLGYWYDVYRWRRTHEELPPDFIVSLDEEVTYRESNDGGDETEDEDGGESVNGDPRDGDETIVERADDENDDRAT